MSADLTAFRRAASILFGKLEMDVTRDELAIARKARKLQMQGKTMAAIRAELKIPSVQLSEASRRRVLLDQAAAISINMGSQDNSRARSEGRCGRIGPKIGA